MSLHNLLDNAVDIADKAHLEAALASGKKLRVKFGIDPTAPDLHLGHAVVLRKLRAFQDAGHQAVLIIGDFTAMIGDPTGKSTTRPILTKEHVKANLDTYLAQAGAILNIKTVEIRHNSEWLSESLPKLIELMGKVSIQQILHRADFKKRMGEEVDISMLEIMYPLLQGYDSVAIKADLELGGTDQTFNMLMGRRVQRAFNVPEQDVMTLPLIEGTDGEHKMSKSLGNYIALNDNPFDMFGKIMSLPDALMPKYFALLTDIPMPRDEKPRDAKALLARTIVHGYFGAKAGEDAEHEFVNVHGKKEMPADMPEIYVTADDLKIIDALLLAEVKSKTEARRLIEQGGVKIDGITITDPEGTIAVSNSPVLQIGKLKFFRIKK
ncbi:MAG: tyrosine--tRNA ligase [Candidatus Pacebacteria bacterium]|nr:tyrosine--tRNA ligase [Candidatus Paceibacterota bacterium]